jgi:hypothetical protein
MNTPDPQEAIQTPHAAKVRGLLIAALVALGMSAFKDLFFPAFFHFDDGSAPLAATPYLVFGLGVAIALSFLVGYPLWNFAEEHGLSKPLHAATLGAAAGALIGLAHAAFVRVALTTDARSFTIFSVLWTILAGALCGFIARTAAGSPKQKARDEPEPSQNSSS